MIGLAVSYAGLMYTSNLVMVLFTPLLAAYVLVLTIVYALPKGVDRHSVRWWQRLKWWLLRCIPPALGAILGLGLSAAFWLPMLLERNDVRVDQWFGGRYDFRGHFVYLFQLFSPNWGFGVSVPGPLDPISFQIGAVALIFAAIGVLLRGGAQQRALAGKWPSLLRRPSWPPCRPCRLPPRCGRCGASARCCRQPSFPGAGWC